MKYPRHHLLFFNMFPSVINSKRSVDKRCVNHVGFGQSGDSNIKVTWYWYWARTKLNISATYYLTKEIIWQTLKKSRKISVDNEENIYKTWKFECKGRVQNKKCPKLWKKSKRRGVSAKIKKVYISNVDSLCLNFSDFSELKYWNITLIFSCEATLDITQNVTH